MAHRTIKISCFEHGNISIPRIDGFFIFL